MPTSISASPRPSACHDTTTGVVTSSCYVSTPTPRSCSYSATAHLGSNSSGTHAPCTSVSRGFAAQQLATAASFPLNSTWRYCSSRGLAGVRFPSSTGSSTACSTATPSHDTHDHRGQCQLQSVRGILGVAAATKRGNPQIHTHDKYKVIHPQPEYKWMRGRFILDRNDAVWHRSAGFTHKRYNRSASQLTRLKRWKPLAPAYANTMIKLGFREKYWSPPDPYEVPGFHAVRGLRPKRPPLVRWNAKPDKRTRWGDPALRQN